MSSDEVKMILQRLGSIETGIVNLGTRLEALEDKVEDRLHDTRPLWEGVQAQIAQLREETQQGFRFLNKKLELLVEDIVNVRTDQRILERRVDDIEKRIPL